ncbi:MAG: ABC transporter substrate-binding protein [Eubacteriales bacterium]
MKRFWAMALTGALCLGLLGGCSAEDTSTGGTGATGGSESASGGEEGTNESGGEIVVGLIANTSGSAAQYGIAVSNGANFYFDEINAAGGINGKTISVKQYDDKGDPQEIPMLFDRLVGDGATAIVGSVLTGATLVLADATYAANMPQITASATSPAVTVMDDTGEVRTNVFRSCFTDAFQGVKMAEYAMDKLGATTAAVIYDNGDDYASGLKDAFVAQCEILGITVVASEGYATGDVAFQSQLTTIAGQSPDVIFAPNYYSDVGLIVTQARQLGIESTFLGGDGWAGVKNYASAEDLEGSAFCSGFSGDADFEANMKAKYGDDIEIGMFEALGYDAALILVEALIVAEEAGLETGSDAYKEAVIAAMSATSGLEGLTGSFEFDENNDPIKTASIMVVTGGEEVFTEQY